MIFKVDSASLVKSFHLDIYFLKHISHNLYMVTPISRLFLYLFPSSTFSLDPIIFICLAIFASMVDCIYEKL